MKQFLLAVIGVLTLSLAEQALAHDKEDAYYLIDQVKVELIDEVESVEETNFVELKSTKGVGEVIAVGREIIAFGKEIYQIVEAGKPVVNTSYSPISVLPYNSKQGENINPMFLSQWRGPKSVKYKVTYTNLFGMDVVEFVYNVNMSYGGTFNGKGYYLTNVQIVPESVYVAWGFTFNATMKLVGITNKGNQDFPVAAATLSLSYSVSTVLQDDRHNITFEVTGDGAIKRI